MRRAEEYLLREILTVVYHGGTQPETKRRLAPVGVIGEHLRALALPKERPVVGGAAGGSCRPRPAVS